MNEIVNDKKLEFQILKNRIENLKNKKRDIKRKNILLNSNKTKKLLLLKRPKSNYIPNSNKIFEKGKQNNNDNSRVRGSSGILVNKLISTSEISENSLSFINYPQKNFNNYRLYENNKEMDKSIRNIEKEFYKDNIIPKSAKHELKINRSFLNENTIFNKVNNNKSQKAIRGCLSPRNDIHKNKYLEITRELFSGKKRNNLIPNSPSTTNNSNINIDNSYSSHFLFGVSSFNSNIYNPKMINYVSEDIFKNREDKIKKNSKENSKVITSIENNINRLLLRRESSNNNKNNKLRKETINYNFEDFYKCYVKNINNKNERINIPIKKNDRNKIKKEENICKNNTINLIKSTKFNNRKNEEDKVKNTKKTNIKKTSNLIIKYAFLNNEIHGIKRKVDFVNPKRGEQIKLDTANIDKNNKLNNREDFKTYGYELTPEELYKLYQKELQKCKRIKIRGEKIENKIFKENEDKIIYPRYYISKQNKENVNKNQRFRKIIINKENNNSKLNEEDKTTKDMGNDTNDLLNVYSFGLGESLYKNKLDFKSIKKEDIEDGKKLWLKLNKSENKINYKKNIKLKESSSYINKNEIKRRVKSVKIKKELISNKLNKKEKTKKEITKDNNQNKTNKINNNKTFERNMKRKNYTQKINTLEQHKLFRNEKGFNEIKNIKNNNIYNINFRITDEEEDVDCTIDEIIEEKRKKEIEDLEEKDESYKNNKKNIFRRRNITANFGQIINKIDKNKKKSKKEIYRINNNKINKNQYNKNKEKEIIKGSQKQNKYNNKSKIINRKEDKKHKEREKYKYKIKKEEIKLIKNKETNENNDSKNKSMEIKENKILNELDSSLKEEENHYSEDNSININNIRIDNLIKRKKIKKQTLLSEKLMKNFKLKYKEDENMNRYFEQIFNKYGNEQLVDVKFCGFNFKIKRKNQNNFKNILMKIIRQKEENKNNYSKLNIMLEKLNKDKNIVKSNSSILFEKSTKRDKNENDKEIPKKEKKNQEVSLIMEEKDEEEFKSKYFLGIKMNSVDELEQKKEEILKMIKDDIKIKIMKKEIGHSEMDNFLNFEKRMNAYHIDSSNDKNFIKLLEQEFISFEEELKIKEQKKKEERRINSFINNMYYDFERDYYMKIAQKKYFCNVIDFHEKNNINILSPTNKI